MPGISGLSSEQLEWSTSYWRKGFYRRQNDSNVTLLHSLKRSIFPSSPLNFSKVGGWSPFPFGGWPIFRSNVILGGVHIIENIARNQINTFNTVVSDRWDWNKNCSCQSPPTAEALERPNWEDVKWWLLQSWQVPCCLFVGWIYGTWKEVLPPPTIKRLLP